MQIVSGFMDYLILKTENATFYSFMLLASVLEWTIHPLYPGTGHRHAVFQWNALIQPREMKSINCVSLNLICLFV